MLVTLLQATPPEAQVSQVAAAMCVGQEDNPSDKNLEAALASGHLSILEHIYFTFKIEGVSRALSHQLVRH